MTPRAAGFPATTPCSVTGGTAVVNEPMPAPGTSTPATIGTLDGQLEPGRRGAERVERHRGGRARRRVDRVAGELGDRARRGVGHHLQLRVGRAGHHHEQPGGAARHRQAGDHQGRRRARPPAAARRRRRCRPPRPRRPPGRCSSARAGRAPGSPCTNGVTFSADELARRDRDGAAQPVLLAGVGQDGHVDAGRDGPGVHQVQPDCVRRRTARCPRTTCRSPGGVQLTRPVPDASDCSASNPSAIWPVAATEVPPPCAPGDGGRPCRGADTVTVPAGLAALAWPCRTACACLRAVPCPSARCRPAWRAGRRGAGGRARRGPC